MITTLPLNGAQGIPLLTTKLHIPSIRLQRIPLPRLIERLDEIMRSGRTLVLVSALAGNVPDIRAPGERNGH
jgi:hypothetical protein